MNATKTSHRARWPYLLATVLCLLMLVTPAFAAGSGGNVVPAADEIKGYSLTEAAKATANFNYGPRTDLSLLPEDFQSRKIQMLFESPIASGPFHVEPGTALYVPFVYSDNTDAPPGAFPNVNDQAAIGAYYYDRDKYGADYIMISVDDGAPTFLGREYAAGAETPVSFTGGVAYTVIAAFLTPLTPGEHEIHTAIHLSGAYLGGDVFEWSTTYKVIVD